LRAVPRSVAILISTVLLMPLGIAHADIYWTSTSPTFQIGSARSDASGANPVLITGVFSLAVALDGSNLYWANRSNGTIGRSNLDGSGVIAPFIAGGVTVQGVGVNSSHVFWSNAGTGRIGRANLDGTGVDPLFIPASAPQGVAVNDSYVCWASALTNRIGRAKLDGTGVEPSFITGGANPVGVAVDRQYIYWANFGTGAIGRANLDGTGVNRSFMTGLGSVFGLAVNSPQTIRFPAPAASSVTAGAVALTASASSGLPVSYTSDTPAVCAVSGDSALLLAPGDCAITARQAGNNRYAAAQPVQASFAVTPAPVLPTPKVTVKAASRRSKLSVRVTPKLADGQRWKFRVQYKKRGSWSTSTRTYRTKSAKQTRTLNLKKGVYRVVIQPGFGYGGVTSRAVSLRR
jgi:hypothetical protein